MFSTARCTSTSKMACRVSPNSSIPSLPLALRLISRLVNPECRGDGNSCQGLALEGHGALCIFRELAEDKTRDEGTEQRRLLRGEIIIFRLRVTGG